MAAETEGGPNANVFAFGGSQLLSFLNKATQEPIPRGDVFNEVLV